MWKRPGGSAGAGGGGLGPGRAGLAPIAGRGAVGPGAADGAAGRTGDAGQGGARAAGEGPGGQGGVSEPGGSCPPAAPAPSCSGLDAVRRAGRGLGVRARRRALPPWGGLRCARTPLPGLSPPSTAPRRERTARVWGQGGVRCRGGAGSCLPRPSPRGGLCARRVCQGGGCFRAAILCLPAWTAFFAGLGAPGQTQPRAVGRPLRRCLPGPAGGVDAHTRSGRSVGRCGWLSGWGAGPALSGSLDALRLGREGGREGAAPD